VEQEVQWLLTEKLVRVRTRPETLGEDLSTDRSRILTSFGSTLEALRYVDAITEEESTEWGNKMWHAIGLESPEPSGPGKVRLVYLGEGDPPPQLPTNLVPRYPRRVVGQSEAAQAFGGTLRIEEVEYDDSVTLVRWQIAPMPDVDVAFPEVARALVEDTAGMDEWAIEHFKDMNRQALQRFRVPPLELSDDVGTVYSGRAVGGSGSGAEWKGIAAFTPGTPSHARRLSVHWLGASAQIAL
jgi:hypothetical protein